MMENSIKVSTYNINGYAYLSASPIDVPTAYISGDFFTSGVVSGTSTDQKYLWLLSGSSLQNTECIRYVETLTFSPGSYISTSSINTFIDDTLVRVSWGSLQEQINALLYGIDYTIDDHNKIHLNEILYKNDIEANTLGLLNVVITYTINI